MLFKYLYELYLYNLCIVEVGDDVFMVVFELFVDLCGVWEEVLEGMVIVVYGVDV